MDRFGLSWRPELAADILVHLEHIDVLEVMAEPLVAASRRELEAVRALARTRPVLVHALSLGLASAAPIAEKKLDALARVLGQLEPESWSEHLAFVRGGGREIGHLTAPPRSEATIEGACRNIARAGAVVGARPLLENIATLLEPPGSELDEPGWIGRVLGGAGAELLLDLNNLYANACNTGQDPRELLRRMPVERVLHVHLAGGRWLSGKDGKPRLLDDHRHAVPDVVYELLEELGARAPRALTVVLERDGRYPPFGELLGELERARGALARGRARSGACLAARMDSAGVPVRSVALRSAERVRAIEAYLARLHTDVAERALFMAEPVAAAMRAGLDEEASAAFAGVELGALDLAAQGSEHKRAAARVHAAPWLVRIARQLRG
jgi:uncharacterized protein (UPF0276 family)